MSSILKAWEITGWRSLKRLPVVAVNGCFDVLHAGHVRLLQFAADHGVVIVGLNSDAAIRILKGPTRPINNETDRATVIAALECVSAVTIFNDTNAVDFLTAASPNFWIKGGDYALKTIHPAERLAVEDVGGVIRLFPLSVGLSSTKLINAGLSATQTTAPV